jgi:hypothetical protein
MDDHERVDQLIDQLLRDAKITSPRARDELRRELESHFAEAGCGSSDMAAVLDRFGSPQLVSEQLGRVHRGHRVVRQALRILAATILSAFVAVGIQVVVSVRINPSAGVIGMGRAFGRSAMLSLMIVVVLVAAWELDIESLCARLEREPLRLALTLTALAMAMLLFHAAEMTDLHVTRAFLASAVDMIVWGCTIAILARLDRAFAGAFTPLKR